MRYRDNLVKMRESPRNFEASAVAAREFNANSTGNAGNNNVTNTNGVRARFLLRLVKG